jgi:imidazolonepropionase-like amidohydrolase
VLSGAAPLIVGINRAADIRTLIKLKQNRNLNVIILGGSEAWKVARELSIAGIPVILDPTANLPSQFEDLGATLQNAARLNAAGVTIAFDGTASASGSHSLFLTPQLAGNAVANGLPYGVAMAALTINPAKIYGVSATHGTLEVGKVADVVIWDGDPLELSSRPTNVFIGGRSMPLGNRQEALRDRYKDLEPGDLPFAYRGRN